MEEINTEKKTSGIMIAATKSGSGKTTITCAFLEALRERGLNPCAFKCGPDYIDPLFHREVIGVPSHNLDSFFSTEKQLREIYQENMRGKGIAVVEGAMGLFDGIGGTSETGSAYHVASILKLPILLVVDAHGMGRSILPLLSGFLQYDREKRIAGILLNKVSERFYRHIAPVIEKELGIPVLGFLPDKPEIILESRHLGLKLPEEIDDLKEQIHVMAKVLEANVAVETVVEIAMKQASEAGDIKKDDAEMSAQVRIGIARDEAFCFYYEENLRLLVQNGAELVSFSPLHDRELPKGLDAILLGGGYPELYAKQLEDNQSMRQSVKTAINGGMPSIAECGGFMYLHHEIEDDKGRAYKMCGVLPGKCFYTGKLVRFGYIEIEEKKNNFMKCGVSIKGHEFHYYDSSTNGQDCVAKKPAAEKSWECMFDNDSHFWGFPHLYYLSNPDFVSRFIEMVKTFHETRKAEKDTGI